MSETLRARLLTGGALLLIGLALTVVIGQVRQLRPGGKAPAQQANPVICTACGHEDRQTTQNLPLRCPRCGERAMHLAGICPRCQVWTPWDVQREKELIEQPGLFIQRGAAYFFPLCKACGTPTNAVGADPPKRAK